MAKRTRIIEGTWTCSSCETRDIPGREKTCTSCGNPRERDGESNFDFGPTSATGRAAREAVSDADALDLARAGADWHCLNCGAANRGDQPSCRTCAAPAPERPGTPPPPPSPAAPKRKGNPVVGCLVLLLLLACCGFCVGGGIWGAQTKKVEGTVSAMTWSRAIGRETFTSVEKEGWRDELTVRPSVMPTAGEGGTPGVDSIGACERKQRSTRKIPDGAERVCRTKTKKVQTGTREKCERKDLGNGFAEETCEDVPVHTEQKYEECKDEPRYRTEPVYDQFCRYASYDWVPAGPPAVLTGTDASPRWPDVPTGPLDRVTKKESYTVTFSWKDGDEARSETRQPATEAEFRAWTPGQKVTLEVSNVGNLEAIEP